MSASYYEIVTAFADNAGKPVDQQSRIPAQHGNITVSNDVTTIYSYKHHFPMAVIRSSGNNPRAWWLVNSDTYSNTTNQHQRLVRDELSKTKLPMLLVPFSALDSARIYKDTIVPVEILDDTWVRVQRTSATLADVPSYLRPELSPNNHATQLPDGSWTWEESRHVMGESVFRAKYQTYSRERGYTKRGAYFLSAFDNQEARHYFLCEMPRGARPKTVDEAVELLKPSTVVEAIANGLDVTRQGDVFAIPTNLTTREITRMSPDGRKRNARLLGLSHVATESAVTADGTTYARGILWHRPFESWRRPEHRRQPMGDRKTWHVIVKNTVPVESGRSRAWSISGNVD